jgi:hypothetical protein
MPTISKPPSPTIIVLKMVKKRFHPGCVSLVFFCVGFIFVFVRDETSPRVINLQYQAPLPSHYWFNSVLKLVSSWCRGPRLFVLLVLSLFLCGMKHLQR